MLPQVTIEICTDLGILVVNAKYAQKYTVAYTRFFAQWVVGLALAGAALLLVVRLALAGAEVVEDVCASSTSSPSDSSKNSFPTSSAIYVTDRVLKQLVKNLVFTFEFFSREKCAVLRVVGVYTGIHAQPRFLAVQ